jgi:hypothetical protein
MYYLCQPKGGGEPSSLCKNDPSAAQICLDSMPIYFCFHPFGSFLTLLRELVRRRVRGLSRVTMRLETCGERRSFPPAAKERFVPE